MSGFVVLGSAGLILALLATSGVSHALRWHGFRSVLRDHALLPRRLAGPAAVTVVSMEFALAGAALTVLAGAAQGWLRLALFAGAAGTGGAFFAYLGRLLAVSPAAGRCGCSPVEGPLTWASRVPAVLLATGGVAGLVVELVSRSAPGPPPASPVDAAGAGLLPTAWGATLAGLALLVQATAPPGRGVAS